MEVLKQENVIRTNRARFPRLCVAAGFATGFAGGACTGFQAGSIMFLQGNNVKVFVKMKVLKSQGVKCRCTYVLYLGDTYKLRGGGRGGVSVSGVRGAVFGWAPPHPLVSTTNFTVVTSVSLQRKPYKCIHT